MTTDSNSTPYAIEVDIEKILPAIDAIMHTEVGKLDRPHGSTACLLAYFLLVCPRPMSHDMVLALMEAGSAALIPILAKVLKDAPPTFPTGPMAES